jgi:hypothetical protein
MRTIHRAGILLNLLREDFRRRIQGVMTPLPQTPIHRGARGRQPKTDKRHPGGRGDLKQRPALLGFQYRIDDHRIPRGERIGRLSAQRPIDAARHLRGIGTRRIPRQLPRRIEPAEKSGRRALPLWSDFSARGATSSDALSPDAEFALTRRRRGVDSNLEFLDAFARSASSSDLLERAFWR